MSIAMEPMSPSSPHSPVKAMVDKIYNAKMTGEALPKQSSKKTFVFQPKSFYNGSDENDVSEMPTQITDLSPTRIRANRDNAVHHFRQARYANARYASYKKVEEDKKMRSKSESALATKKMRDAANKLMALQAITKTGGSTFAARVAAEKLAREARGESMEVKMRITEASSAAVIQGRR